MKPQMNADERRSKTLFLICVYLCSSAAFISSAEILDRIAVSVPPGRILLFAADTSEAGAGGGR